jgi:molybdopterin biosynthesis enzyme
MAATDESLQRIARLMPLKHVLARIAVVAVPVPASNIKLSKALHRVVADDVVAQQQPTATLALRDGYAVPSDATVDASSYAPMPLADARAIETGERLPAGTDAVMPHDAVLADHSGVQALAVVARGDGTLPAGADADPGRPIGIAGKLLRHVAVAALAAAGVGYAKVRVPRVRILAARKDPILREIVDLFAGLVVAAGGEVTNIGDSNFDTALRDRSVRLIVVVGGSGSGSHDHSVSTLARVGRIEAHGIGLIPGETAALGVIEQTLVLVVPGRVDAAFAVWVTLGEAIMRGLTGCTREAAAVSATLTRKITSTIGMVEVVPVQLRQSQATPLATGYLPLQALAITDGYVVVPAESEGFAEGAAVAVKLMP